MTFEWFVGLFEGEGYISASKKTPHLFVLGITSTDRDVLDRVVDIAGGKIYGPYIKEQGRIKPQYTWYLSTKKETVPLLERMIPLLCERRKTRAMAALAALETWQNKPASSLPRKPRKRKMKDHEL